MSELFTYISTKTTADPYIPAASRDLRFLARDVSDALTAISGGHQVVGRLAFYPLQRSVPGHLLCDGQEVAKVSFPELYEYLGDTQGTPADADNFVLPNFLGTIAPAATADPETVTNGTVNTSGSGDTFGDVDSGGKPTKLDL